MNKTDTLYDHLCSISAEMDTAGKALNDLYLYYMTIVEEHLSPKNRIAHEGLNALDDALTNLEKSRDCVSTFLERLRYEEGTIYNPRFMDRFTRVQ